LGPLTVDWTDPRLVVDAGVSTDASGHRRRVVTDTADGGDVSDGETAEILPAQTTEVRAVPSAGAVIRSQPWGQLDGDGRDAGVSTDASGHRRRVVTDTADGGDVSDGETAEILPEQTTEVLAVPSAGALISRQLWEQLDGYDRELRVFAEDVDFGWRANVAGSLVLNVPAARLRHAKALSSGERTASASHLPVRALQRAHGMR